MNLQREKLGKKRKLVLKNKKEGKKIKVSRTDPESGYYYHDEKEKGFKYCYHRTVDGRHNIIIDTYVTHGNVHDSVLLIDRLKYIEENVFNFNQIVLDSGYFNYDIMKYLEDNDKFSVIAYRRYPRNKDIYPKSKFIWDVEKIVIFVLRATLKSKNSK
ncbi:transposase [Mycoplasmatota bacterium]|nr:transposase [Mycoplasmatota bacterium]